MCFVKGSMRSRASVRTLPAELDELARLHDGRQTPAIPSEHSNVLQRVSVNDQDIRAAARLDFAEMRLHHDLGIDGGCGPQDGGGRLNVPPNDEFSGLMSMEVAQKVRSKADLQCEAVHDLQTTKRLITHLSELFAHPGRQQSRFRIVEQRSYDDGRRYHVGSCGLDGRGAALVD